MHVQRVNDELKGLYENLDTLDRELQNLQRRSLMETATGKSQQYKSHFPAVVDIITERNDYVDNYLDVLGPKIAADGQSVVESIQADQGRLGPQVQRNKHTAILTAIIVSAAAFVLGIVLAFFIIRGILRQLGADPVVREEIAGRIALGDLDIEFADESIRGVYLSVKHRVDALRYKAGVLEEIAQASREQAQAIEQITEGLDQIDQATQAGTASAEESASASEELAGQAQQLKGMVGQFRLDARLVSLSQEGGSQRQIPAPRRESSPAGGSAHSSALGGTQASKRGKSPQNETGIRPVHPNEVIHLDDDDFDRF